MSGKRLDVELANVEVEHLLGLATGLPLVKLRVESDDTVMVGQMAPAEARDIAMHLFEAAARAEYEADLANEAKTAGWTDTLTGQLLMMVRAGERHRHEESQ